MVDWTPLAPMALFLTGAGGIAASISAVIKIYVDSQTIREQNLKLHALAQEREEADSRLYKPTTAEIDKYTSFRGPFPKSPIIMSLVLMVVAVAPLLLLRLAEF